MPFKSKAQMRYFGHLVDTGQMTKEEFEKWMRHTPNIKRLPKRKRKRR